MIKSLLSYLSGKEKTLYFFLTILAGVILLWPLHDFQHYVSQGDHGRDLYCFKMVMNGALPYRDFSWLFGPLMPYYYAAFYILGGVNIQSILLGQMILILLTGLTLYKTCSIFLRPALAFLCAFWYWSFRGPEFFYTYNHSGGILALLVTLYCAFKYIEDGKHRYIYTGFISIFLFMLIRLNMGVSTLLAFVPSLLLTDIIQKTPDAAKRRKLILCLSLAVLAAASLVYGALLSGLPGYAITQSFPYAKTQRTDYTGSLWGAILYSGRILVLYFTSTLAQKIFGLVLLFSALQCALLSFSLKSTQTFKKNIFLIFSSLLIFIILSSHEFFASGVFYRSFWFFPLLLIAVFYLIGTATKPLSSAFLSTLVFVTLFLPPLLSVENDLRAIRSLKTPEHQLHIGPNKVYTLQTQKWFQVVTGAVNFIKDNAKPEDTILALPLDPLYLFLSDRDSATRQLVFFEHINIGEEQERKILSEMENPHANWAIISNRSVSTEGGMGIFGKTYCPLLGQYLSQHFEPVASFGDWAGPPGWGWKHSVQILKRKQTR